ncbi:hypothetical protein FAZ95_09290 [Trinickia violacea]|uniref:Uncharacterized protein n=1 Tax=Trinickia violacea TaxID=2571746 RepID=A0A4P8IQJ3_9BURK|nr:hypothetical protein FAZ95_09290 [Trinickia violacea]
MSATVSLRCRCATDHCWVNCIGCDSPCSDQSRELRIRTLDEALEQHERTLQKILQMLTRP